MPLSDLRWVAFERGIGDLSWSADQLQSGVTKYLKTVDEASVFAAPGKCHPDMALDPFRLRMAVIGIQVLRSRPLFVPDACSARCSCRMCACVRYCAAYLRRQVAFAGGHDGAVQFWERAYALAVPGCGGREGAEARVLGASWARGREEQKRCSLDEEQELLLRA
eukprot:735516-Rhodomonas_salina.1